MTSNQHSPAPVCRTELSLHPISHLQSPTHPLGDSVTRLHESEKQEQHAAAGAQAVLAVLAVLAVPVGPSDLKSSVLPYLARRLTVAIFDYLTCESRLIAEVPPYLTAIAPHRTAPHRTEHNEIPSPPSSDSFLPSAAQQVPPVCTKFVAESASLKSSSNAFETLSQNQLALATRDILDSSFRRVRGT
jgi:hypothetical protein